MIKASFLILSITLVERFMLLVRAELETCPVCNATGKLQIHSYYKHYLIDFIGGKCVRNEVTILHFYSWKSQILSLFHCNIWYIRIKIVCIIIYYLSILCLPFLFISKGHSCTNNVQRQTGLSFFPSKKAK